MKRSLVIFFYLITITVFAQTQFDRVLNIPVTEGSNTLHSPWAGGINFPWMSAIDLNNDGKQDIFLIDHQNNRIETFLNNGNTNADLAWDYAPQYANQFPPVNVWAYLYDYDCDGKPDFFTLSSKAMCSGIACYKNISSGGNLQWALIDSCMQERFQNIHNNIFTSSLSLPNFVDLDGDGDMDILGYNTFPDGRFLYHKNYSVEDYGSCDSLDFVLETVCWGNFQLKIGGSNVVGAFHDPCRMRRPPDSIDSDSRENNQVEYYGQEPPSDQSDAARRDDTISSVFAIDLDGDGYKELLIGDIASNNTLMVHNGGGDMDYQDTLYPSQNTHAFYNGFHYHAFIDVDNDGLKDLLVMPDDHENKKGIWFYKNSGTNISPVFDFTSDGFLQNQMIDVGEDACPVLFDYDGDNLLDLVISKSVFDSTNGTYKTGLYLYKNSGTVTNPSFTFVTDDFGGLSALGLYVSPTYPAFGDLDGDCDKDMIIGLEDGTFHYYENIAGCGNPPVFQGPTPNYMHIDIGKYATPQLYDLNHDGLLDIVCGGERGFINYFQNIGTATNPFFSSTPTQDTLGCINLQHIGSTDGFTVPFLYDSSGTTHLLVANEEGNIHEYDHIDGNLNGCFNHIGTVYSYPESSRVKFNITVSGGDLNGDSLTDIIIGQSTGGAEVRYQHNIHTGISEHGDIIPTFEVFPNPVKDEMTIKFYHIDNHSSVVRIVNSIGKVVMEKNITDENTEIKTSEWSSGIYFIQLTSGKFSLGRKIIVRH